MDINVKRQIEILREKVRRDEDGLTMFRAITYDISPQNNQVAVLESKASEILIRGGNQSAKSTIAAARFAAIARDIPLKTFDGQTFNCRLPWQKHHPLLMWCMGLQINHLTTMHGMLFRPGLYSIIYDRDSHSYRTWCPWLPDDLERSADVKPSWPLIPPSEIEDRSWAWYNKAARQFEMVRLKNGTEIWGLASTADKPKQGDKVDEIWIDEELNDPAHYTEFMMRKTSRRGRISWSAYTNDSNLAIIDISQRAIDQHEEVERGDRKVADVEEFLFTYSGNPYIHPDEKRKVQEALTDDELLARDRGEFGWGQTRIYPTYNTEMHAAIPHNSVTDDEIAKILREREGIPPEDWTHELILDPGTAKPAVLWGAVPPPDLWGGKLPILVVYQELYIPRLTAEGIANKIKAMTPKGVLYRRFIIDGKAAVQKPMGFSKTIMQNYSDELARVGLQSLETGTGFTFGDPNFPQRRMKVESALTMQENGRPRLRIVVDKCRNLVNQMQSNRLNVIDKHVEDKPYKKQKDDLRDALEYWVSRNPIHVPLPKRPTDGITPYELFLKWQGEMFPSQRKADGVLIGPAA